MSSSASNVSDASTLTGWFKSSFSGGGQGECLEVSSTYESVPVRDSKAPHGPALVFSAGGWASFVAAVAEGRFDG
ncbi:DUF397 domain-containing protein [Streptomyces sp. NPDC059446]|uniref:DUF397 domain-containing protein n=1 Tax=Streptomyces sp. NPDC059446 TaxID=3346833 RepID=UPI0036B7ED2D